MVATLELCNFVLCKFVFLYTLLLKMFGGVSRREWVFFSVTVPYVYVQGLDFENMSLLPLCQWGALYSTQIFHLSFSAYISFSLYFFF